jgi:hypothetical protein
MLLGLESPFDTSFLGSDLVQPSVALSNQALLPASLRLAVSLMARTSGRSEISVGLIDGPVLLTHPELSSENIHEVSGKRRELVPGATASLAGTARLLPACC